MQKNGVLRSHNIHLCFCYSRAARGGRNGILTARSEAVLGYKVVSASHHGITQTFTKGAFNLYQSMNTVPTTGHGRCP